MENQSDEIPLDIGFSLAGLLPMHFKNRAHFSVTSIALNDVNVKGGNVLKPFARDISTGQKFVSL